MIKKTAIAAFAAIMAAHAWCEETQKALADRISLQAYADVETAYWARGAIVDSNPYSAQYADLAFDLDLFGRLGAYAWSVSSMSGSGQGASRRQRLQRLNGRMARTCSMRIR